MKIKPTTHLDTKKFSCTYGYTGVQSFNPITGKTYCHLHGTKFLGAWSRRKNLAKSLLLTLASLGFGILFSSHLRRSWYKALLGRVNFDYMILSSDLSDAERAIHNAKRDQLREDITCLGLNTLYSPQRKIIAQYDRELLLQNLNDFDCTNLIPSHLKNDPQIALARMKWEKPQFFKTLDLSLRSDHEFVAQAINIHPTIADFVDFKLFENEPDFFYRIFELTRDFRYLRHASNTVLDDPAFADRIAAIVRGSMNRSIIYGQIFHSLILASMTHDS